MFDKKKKKKKKKNQSVFKGLNKPKNGQNTLLAEV
jgi:hypothetical protein